MNQIVKRSMTKLSIVNTINAPKAIGPYSQAIKSDPYIFLSGCIPLNPITMTVVSGGIEEQTVLYLSFTLYHLHAHTHIVTC